MVASRQFRAILLFGLLLISTGSYLVVPFLAVSLRNEAGISATAVGLALTAKLWGQRAFMLIGGWFTDRFGAKSSILLGLTLRVTSYIAIAELREATLLVVACLVLGSASAFYIPASKIALIGSETDTFAVRRVLALRSGVNNVGTALGPVLGTLVIGFGLRACFWTAAAVFLLLVLVFSALRFPPKPAVIMLKTDVESVQPLRQDSVFSLLCQRQVAGLFLLSVGFGVLYAQLEYGLPVFAESSFGSFGPGLIFVTNAVVVVAVQFVLSSWIGRWSNTFAVLISFALLGAGLSLGGLDVIGFFVVGIALFSVGESVLDPRIDSQVAEIVTPNRQGLVFGWLGVGVAVGGTCGNLVPGIVGRSNEFIVAWLAIGITGVIVAFLWRAVFATARTSRRVNVHSQSTSSP